MPIALDLGLGSKIQAQSPKGRFCRLLHGFHAFESLQKFNESLCMVAKESNLGGPKELKLDPDHAQRSRSRLLGVQDPGPEPKRTIILHPIEAILHPVQAILHPQDDFVDRCMVFMRWKVAELA